MAPLAVLVLLIVIVTPIAWLAAEFTKCRPLRITLGVAAIASAIGIAYLVGHLSRLSYNAWYGSASKNLVDTTLTEIEDGNVDRVVSVLRRLNLDYQPTYENRAHYDEVVNEAVSQMKGEGELDGTRWDTVPFSRETWLGHWENDTGYWIVIHYILDYKIVRSGDNMPEMTDIVMSDDYSSLTFTEGDRWRHELTLNNKYEATHVCHDLTSNSVWRTETLHKLRRATQDERAFTQQNE